MLPTTEEELVAAAEVQVQQDAIFIEQYRRTGDAVTACVRAGIRDPRYAITVLAERQLARPEIQAALKAMENMEIVSQPLEVTRNSIVSDMEEVFQKALQDSQYAAAIGAKKLQAVLLGIFEAKVNITHTHDVTKMSTEDLVRIVQNGGGKSLAGPVIDVADQEQEEL